MLEFPHLSGGEGIVIYHFLEETLPPSALSIAEHKVAAVEFYYSAMDSKHNMLH